MSRTIGVRCEFPRAVHPPCPSPPDAALQPTSERVRDPDARDPRQDRLQASHPDGLTAELGRQAPNPGAGATPRDWLTILTYGRDAMPLYLSKFSYTPETWARLTANPEDRRAAARAYIESVGGTLHGFWYAFGTHDGYNLWEAPDDVSMAAVALAISAGGALSSFETTVLLTVEETLAALHRAREVGYRAPGA
jgi:uncharacterized protein with GYD domain